MTELPTGTVTFLFTDVEGSTKLLHELGAEAYDEALIEHRRVLREAFGRHGGVEVDTQGDAFFYAFPSATGALHAASEGQSALATGPITVRMGLHTGTPHIGKEGYIGDDVHLGARVASSGHGGQVILSAATAELVELELRDLGEHRLKDIAEAVPIFQFGDGAFPPLKTISNTNLPRPASSFVGRDDELREVLSRFVEGARLVTLTGPGGTGKTRLAIEAAATLVPEFKAGVFWVGLATLRDPALVTETIAQTLGAKDGLAEHIGERELLLLLDNLEQVVECAPELSVLLTACTNLTLLVTSRELLRIQGEVEYSVPPLAEAEAVSLFCTRSGLGADETVAELCNRLDSLPLAVELAAARTNALTPEQILDRLSQRLDLLKGGRDADPRQQTLRATIEWSYDLLTEEEQQLFARLSVFAGGCTLEAAEEVARADLDTLQSLVEKSLVRFTSGRYWLLETIREYAIERLEVTGMSDEMFDRYAAYMFERYGHMPREGSDWVPLLEAERDNLRAAMTWTLLDRGDSERSLTLATAYGALSRSRGPFSEGRSWLDAALELGDQATPDARWKALYAAASLATVDGDLDRAEKRAAEALRVARDIGEPKYIGRSIRVLGIVEADKGDIDRSEELQREALAIFTEGGDERDVRESLGLLAFLAIMRRDWSSAQSAVEEALALSYRADDKAEILRNTANLGHVLARQGNFDEARVTVVDSVRLAYQSQNLFGLASQLEDLAGVAAGLGRCEDAAVLLGGAAALYESTGHSVNPAFSEWRDELMTEVRRNLDAAQCSELLQQGRVMTPEELVAYAEGLADEA